MGSEDDQLIATTWQLAIKVNVHLISLVKVNFKAISSKDVCGLTNERFVWLNAIKLVNYSCPEEFGRGAMSFRAGWEDE